MKPDVSVFIEARAGLGEGPVWHEPLDELHFVDIDRGAIRRISADGTAIAEVLVGEAVGSAVPTSDGGGWIVGTRSGVSEITIEGVVKRHLDIDADRERHRMNDGCCDARGRFWTGSLNEEPGTPSDRLYRVDPDWSVTTVVDDVALSNGLAWSPDATVMYRVDSSRRAIFAATYDIERGVLRDEHVMVDMSAGLPEPDGLTVDADGTIWVALWNGFALHRYSPLGELLAVVDLPVRRPTSVAFGGIDYSTLFVTSALKGLTDEELAAQPHAGAVFAIDAGVRGVPPAYFGV